ncbi:MAG TPA: hypothetical protein VMS12_07410 [Thermoanaerobaculia bacterium]|nr:hypothetical protein [Thermoanaerobaculia bacterium]
MKRPLTSCLLALLVTVPLAATDDCSLLHSWGERGITRDLLVHNGTVIAADGQGVTVYDVTNPAVIRHRTVVQTDTESLRLARVENTLAVLTASAIEVYTIGTGQSLGITQVVEDRVYSRLAAGDGFLAAAGAELDIFSVSAGRLDRVTSVPLARQATALLVVGNVVFVGSVEGGLVPYRYSGGTLTPLDSIAVPALNLTAQGSFLYVAGGGTGITPIDVSNADAPVTRPRLLSGASDIRQLAVSGNRLYAADALGGSRIHVFDLADPGQPSLITTFEEPADAIAASGTTLFTAGTLAGAAGARLQTGAPLRMLDLSDPASQILAGEFLDRAGPLSGVATDGAYAYVADPPLFRVIDIRSPLQPREVASIALDDSADHVRISGNRAIVYGRADVHMIDITSPAHPIYLGVYRSLGTIPSSADYSGDLLIEANRASGFHVMDVSDPTFPIQLSGLKNDSFGAFLGVVAIPGVAYGFAVGGVKVVDLSDPADARLDHVILTNKLIEAEIAPATTTHSQLLLVVDTPRLRLFDISAPLVPLEIISIPIPEDTVDLAAGPNIGYLVTRSGSLLRVDYTAAANPVITNVLEGLTRPTQVAIAADGTGDVLVADGYSLAIFQDPAAARVAFNVTPFARVERHLGPASVAISWTPSAAGSVRYEIQTSSTDDFRAPVSRIVTGNEATIAIGGNPFVRVRATSGCQTSGWSNVLALSESDLMSPRFLESQSRVFINAEAAPFTIELPVVNTSSAPVDVSIADGLQNGVAAGPPVTLAANSRGTIQLSIDPSILADQNDVLTSLALSGSGDLHELRITRLRVAARERSTDSPLLVLPGVAAAPGARNTFFRSDLNLVCRKGSPCDVAVTFAIYGSSENSPAVDLTLRSGESVVLRDVVATVFGLENAVGAIEVRSTALDNVQASGSTYNEGGEGKYGQRLSSWRVDPSTRNRSATRRLLGAAQNETFRTNLGMVNATGSAVSVFAQAVDSSGNVVASSEQMLAPWQGIQIPITTLFGISSFEGGSVRVSTVNGVALYQSKVDQRTGDGTFSQALFVPDEITPDGFPSYVRVLDAAASTPGAEGTFFRTALQIVNEGSSEEELELTFIPTGSPQGAEVRRIVLAPEGALTTEDLILDVLGNTGVWTGSLRIESRAPFTGWGRIYNDSPIGTFGQFAPVHDVSPARKGEGAAPENGPLHKAGIADVPSARTIFPVSSDLDRRTNLGIFETAGKHAVLRLEVYDGAGNFLGAFDRTVAPLLSLPLFGVLEDLGLSGLRDLRIQIDESGAENLSVYASLVERQTGDAVFIPAE